MRYSIYIDVVFLVNLVMDIIILNTVRILLKFRTSVARVIAAAAAGSLWACIIVVYPVFPVWVELLITYVGISGLMVKTAFKTQGIRELIKGVLGLYLAAVALGGAMYALYQHTRLGYYVEQLIRGRLTEGMPLIILLLLAAGAYLGNRYLWMNLLEVRKQKSSLYEVTLTDGVTVIKTTGLLDTGNHLYEPISHRPVHVVSDRIWDCFKKQDNLLSIPYHTIGTEEGVMPGMIIDSMVISGEQDHKIVIKPLIAVSPHDLSREGSYEMLLHEDN